MSRLCHLIAMLTVSSSLLLSISPARLAAAPVDEGNSVEAAIKRLKHLETEYGLMIHYEYDRQRFFPASWLRQPIAVRGGQVDTKELPRLAEVIEEFLSRYPKKVIRDDLKQVYLVSDLQFFGKSYGATNSATGIYLRTGNARASFEDSFLLARLHSEFSSVLMRNHNFPKKDWAALNAPDFEYSGTGVEVLEQDGLYGQTKPLLERGFLVKYSQSSMENDFNMISDWLFTRPTELEQLCEKYKLLNAKRKLATEFYDSMGIAFEPSD